MVARATQNRYYRALIFDLYGTLVEIYKRSEYMENLHEIVDILGLDFESFKSAWHNVWLKYPYGDYPSLEGRFEEAFKCYFDGDDYFIPSKKIKKAVKVRLNYITNQHLKVKSGVLEALKWSIDQGYKLGMISNCSIETAITWDKNPISKFIPDPSFSCLVKIKKPEAEIYLNELNKLHVDPERCIYFGDGDDNELTTARELGVTTVLVRYKVDDDVFRREPIPNSDLVLDDFQDLPRLVMDLERLKSS
ncbi:MAG: HAD family hydrolase [Promethearchaeota archaeon]